MLVPEDRRVVRGADLRRSQMVDALILFRNLDRGIPRPAPETPMANGVGRALPLSPLLHVEAVDRIPAGRHDGTGDVLLTQVELNKSILQLISDMNVKIVKF